MMDRNSGLLISPHSSHTSLSSINPHLSRSSMYSTTDISLLREVLDFTKENIPGLSSIKTDYLNFDFGEGDIIARTQLQVSGPKFNANFVEERINEFGIDYFGVIRVNHNDITTEIAVPNE